MASGDGTETTPRPPLERGPKLVLVGWLAVAGILTISFLVENQGAGDWSDLVNAIAATFVVASLLAVGLTYVLVRYVAADPLVRVAVALVGPPGWFLLAAFSLWIL